MTRPDINITTDAPLDDGNEADDERLPEQRSSRTDCGREGDEQCSSGEWLVRKASLRLNDPNQSTLVIDVLSFW